MPTSERSLTPQEHAQFKNDAAIGFRLISEVPCSPVAAIVAGIDDFIHKRQGPLRNFTAPLKGFQGDDPAAARALGTVWGNQMVRAFGWEWICVTLGETEHFVVAAPDRSLVVFAHEYAWKCMESNDLECSIALSFDLVRGGAIERPPALTYTSMMPRVKRTRARRGDPLTASMKQFGSKTSPKQWDEACRDCAHA